MFKNNKINIITFLCIAIATCLLLCDMVLVPCAGYGVPGTQDECLRPPLPSNVKLRRGRLDAGLDAVLASNSSDTAEIPDEVLSHLVHVLTDEDVRETFPFPVDTTEKTHILQFEKKNGRDVLDVNIDFDDKPRQFRFVFYTSQYNQDLSIQDRYERLAKRLITIYKNFRIGKYEEILNKIGVEGKDIVDCVEQSFRMVFREDTIKKFDAGGDAIVYINASGSMVIKSLNQQYKEVIRMPETGGIADFLEEHGLYEEAANLRQSIVEKQIDDGPLRGYMLGCSYLGHFAIRCFVIKNVDVWVEENGEVTQEHIDRAVVQKFVPVFFKEAWINAASGSGQVRSIIGIIADAIANRDISTAKLMIDEFLLTIRGGAFRGCFDWDVKAENYAYDASVGGIGSLDLGKVVKYYEIDARMARIFVFNLKKIRDDMYMWAYKQCGQDMANELKNYFEEAVRVVFTIDGFSFDISKSIQELESESDLEEDLKDLSRRSINGVPICYTGTSRVQENAVKLLARLLKDENVDLDVIESLIAIMEFHEVKTEYRSFSANLTSNWVHNYF